MATAPDDLAIGPASRTESENLPPVGSASAPDPGDGRESTRVLSGTQLASEEFPGSWPIFGTNIRLKIGGYVKADAVYDFDATRIQFMSKFNF